MFGADYALLSIQVKGIAPGICVGMCGSHHYFYDCLKYSQSQGVLSDFALMGNFLCQMTEKAM